MGTNVVSVSKFDLGHARDRGGAVPRVSRRRAAVA